MAIRYASMGMKPFPSSIWLPVFFAGRTQRDFCPHNSGYYAGMRHELSRTGVACAFPDNWCMAFRQCIFQPPPAPVKNATTTAQSVGNPVTSPDRCTSCSIFLPAIFHKHHSVVNNVKLQICFLHPHKAIRDFWRYQAEAVLPQMTPPIFHPLHPYD